MCKIVNCEICYTLGQKDDDIFECDICGRLYCWECSYTFSLHYQHQGSRCYECSDQSRIKPLTKDMIRENKIDLLFKLEEQDEISDI